MAANVGSVPTLDGNKHLKTKHVDAPVAALVATPTSASALAVQALIAAAVNALKGGASAALDTLGEVQAALGNDPNLAATLTAAIAAKATPAQIASAISALALGSASTHAAGDFDVAGAAAAALAAAATDASSKAAAARAGAAADAATAASATYSPLLGVLATATTAVLPTVLAMQPYNATAGNLTPALPALSGWPAGATFGVQKAEADASSNTVVFTAAGSDTFDSGATTFTLKAKGELRVFQVVSMGGTKYWKVVGGNTPLSYFDGAFRAQSGSVVAPMPRGGGLDDTAALQAVCDTARAAGYKEVVLQQNAVYLVDGLRPNGSGSDQKSIRLRTEGALGYQLGTATTQASAILRRLPAAVASAGVIGEGHGLEIENVTFDGNGVAGAGYMLDIVRGFETRLKFVRIQNAPSGGLAFRSLSNPRIENLHIQTSGTDGQLAATAGAAPAMLVTGNATYESVSNTVNIYDLHLERNNGVDLQIAPTTNGHDFAEFVNIFGLHIEGTTDNTSYTPKADPLLWVGNVRALSIFGPNIYGGGGTPIYVNRTSDVGNTPMIGTTLYGGQVSGHQTQNAGNHLPDAATPSYLVDLVAGDHFAAYGTVFDCAMTAAVRVQAGFGAHVFLNDARLVTRTGSSAVFTTDLRTGYVVPQRNLSIGGTGASTATAGGTAGGSVTTLTSSGATRNTLDDGTGSATIAGILAMLGGIRMISRTVTATGGLTLADVGVISKATAAITLTLPASSNTFFLVKNQGTAPLTIAAPSSGTGPLIDAAASLVLQVGDQAILLGTSSAAGTWVVLALSSSKASLGAPTLTPGSNLGTGAPTPALDTGSNDRRGRIRFGTGTSPAAGVLIAVAFAYAYDIAPTVIAGVSAQNGTGPFVTAVTTTGFNIGLLSAPVASQALGTYALSYVVHP